MDINQELNPNQKLQDRYIVNKKIGSGSFGYTYIVKDTNIPGEPYRVIKQLLPKDRHPQTIKIATRLFQSEAQSLAKLGEHDGIPDIFDYIQENNNFFIVQKYIKGHDLTK